MTWKNSDIKPWHIAVGYIVVLMLIMLMISGCSVAKRNGKAYQRVLTDSTMFRSIGDKWRKLNPCTNDTSWQLTIIETEPEPAKEDPELRKKIADSLRALFTCDTAIQKAYSSGYEQAKKDVKPKVIREQSTGIVTDSKAIHELQDTIHAYQVREASNAGRLLQAAAQLSNKELEVKEQAKKANLWKWLFFIAIGLWGVREVSKIGLVRKMIGL